MRKDKKEKKEKKKKKKKIRSWEKIRRKKKNLKR